MVWPPAVSIYEEDNSTEHEAMNKPLTDLIDRTDWLKQQIDQITAGTNLVALYANVDATLAIGDAVYLNSTTGVLLPALAKFATEYAADGSLRLSESGYVLGIVLEKPNATSARVWTTGTYTDQTLADAALGALAPAGIYRLSMVTAGALLIDEQEIDILTVVYQGAGVMTLFDKRASIPNHIHQTYLLDQAWLVESDSQFDDMEKPVGATWGYDLANDANMQRIFATVPGSVRIFGDGALIAEADIVGNLDNIWGLEVASPAVTYTVLEATVVMPYTFGEPVLRGARTDTPTELELAAAQGILTANMRAWTNTDEAANGFALKSISGRGYVRAPSISSVGVLGDLEKTDDGLGGIVISLGLGINSFLEPQIVNLDNAIEVSDGYYVYYALPTGRDAKMLGRISLPYFQDANLEAAVITEVQGLAGGGAIPALTVKHSTKAYPAAEVAMGSAWDGTLTMPTPAITANTAKIVEAAEVDRFNVTSRGTVFLEVGFDTPSEDIKITRFGVILYSI